jgi:sugar phosphate isomerase/epimerase
MVEEIKNLGINCIELNFRLSKEIVDGIAELVVEKFVTVLSLHNFCPVPDSIDINKASPDYYSLASLDKNERKKAVEATKITMETACRLKAKAVVVHSGRLDIKDKTRDLAKAIDEGRDVSSLIETMQKERAEELKKGYIDSLLKSMGEISGSSKNCNIKIGLENRFYFRELPSVSEFELIFKYFDADTNIYYWHDTGHAKVFENLGLLSQNEYLEKFSHRLLGVHLHDVTGTTDDHKAPLEGNVNFAILKPYLNKDIPKVLEPHAPATSEQIKRSVKYLKQLYGEK